MALLATSFEQALHDVVESSIFTRGAAYYRSGAVTEWHINPRGTLEIAFSGTVQGTVPYRVEIRFDCALRTITSAECSCPYNIGCKHLIALGLHARDMLRAFESEKQAHHIERRTGSVIRDTIVGFAHTLYTHESLMHPETTPPVPIEKTPKKARRTKRPPMSPTLGLSDQYYIRLSHDLTPSLALKSSPYIAANVDDALELQGLTKTQRELLEALKSKSFDVHITRERDFQKLVSLLQKSDVRVSFAHSANIVPIIITVSDESLRGTVKHLNEEYYDGMRDRFVFQMPEAYWEGRDPQAHAANWISGKDSIALVSRTALTLYRVPNILAPIIARVRETWSDDLGSYSRAAAHSVGYRTELTGEEVWRLDSILAAAEKGLNLTEPLPIYTSIERSHKAEAALYIDHDAIAQTLNAAAVIDYGSLQQNVAESIAFNMADGRKQLALRKNWAGEIKTHRIRVEGKIVRIAPINIGAEIALFEKMFLAPDDIGFTKSLKCSVKGSTQIMTFIRTTFPKLSSFARSAHLPIHFTRDSTDFKSAYVRADFAVDVNEAQDWLHFDVALYCNGERLTLDDIITFIESGETVFRRGNTLLEITNRDELERLVAMLRSFHKREEGFEGKLYHVAELQYVLTSSPHYTAARAASFTQFLNKVHSGKPVEPVSIPESFDAILRPYQKEGIHWLHFLRSYRFAGILADDMGLGKTLQTLALLSMTRIPKEPSLVVCPKTLLFNWKNEANTFAGDMQVLVYEGSPTERKMLRGTFSEYDLIIVSYNTLKKDESDFSHDKAQFNYVVLDEAQFIKNHATKSAQIAKRLNARFRLALTGTPLENNVSEIWSVFDFLMPGFLGSYADFAKRFHKPIMDHADEKALTHLRAKITPFMLRRTKGEVLKDLPPKIEQDMVAELGTAQMVLYQQILAQVKSEVFLNVKEKGFRKSQIHILAGLMKLRQACNHPALLIAKEDRKGEHYESAKMELALELIDEAVAGGHKVLLFSQFTSMLDLVAEELVARNIQHLYLSGKTRDRASMINTFNEGSIPLFLISLKAGGTGLNLTAADTVIIFDPWWNPSVEMQAADRAHRIGQTKTVNVYRLLTKGTIEEKIQDLKYKKKTLADALINSSGDLFTKLTWDDVRGLFV